MDLRICLFGFITFPYAGGRFVPHSAVVNNNQVLDWQFLLLDLIGLKWKFGGLHLWSLLHRWSVFWVCLLSQRDLFAGEPFGQALRQPVDIAVDR
jgi:hypothetical protein